MNPINLRYDLPWIYSLPLIYYQWLLLSCQWLLGFQNGFRPKIILIPCSQQISRLVSMLTLLTNLN